jgi:hypothetical protein
VGAACKKLSLARRGTGSPSWSLLRSVYPVPPFVSLETTASPSRQQQLRASGGIVAAGNWQPPPRPPSARSFSENLTSLWVTGREPVSRRGVALPRRRPAERAVGKPNQRSVSQKPKRRGRAARKGEQMRKTRLPIIDTAVQYARYGRPFVLLLHPSLILSLSVHRSAVAGCWLWALAAGCLLRSHNHHGMAERHMAVPDPQAQHRHRQW